MEPNTIELANYIIHNTNKAVYLVLNKECRLHIRKHVDKDVNLVNSKSVYLLFLLLSCKYIFTTSGTFIHHYSKHQVFVNVGHGIPLKRVGKLLGEKESGINADVTVATSEITEKLLAKAFGVPKSDVFTCGYPRNDMMLRAKNRKSKLKQNIKIISNFDKIIIWLPTFRVNNFAGTEDGKEEGNPFQIKDFETVKFNNILKQYNTLCIVKPHPSSSQSYDYTKFNNLYIMHDEWLSKKGLTLYHLLALTDILITDFSSVMIDYLLLNQPILCFSTDFDAYRKSRGFCYENIEEMLPSKLIQREEMFFAYLKELLETGKDPYAKKRLNVKNLFYKYEDSNSTKRLLDYVTSKIE